MSTMILQDKELLTPRFTPIGGEELEVYIRELKRDSTLAKATPDYHGDTLLTKGIVHVVKRNGDGEISFEGLFENLQTLIGNQYWGERAAGIATPPNQASGMRLGTGVTAVSSTGAGAAIVTYVTGSNVAINGTYPQSANPSAGIRRITFQSSWAAGVATATLAEAVLTNESPLTNVAGTAANTIGRVLLSPTIVKSAADTLDLTWQVDLGT